MSEPLFHVTSMEEGITIRAWLAGQALAGLVGHWSQTNVDGDEIAKMAVSYADALLAELCPPPVTTPS